MLCLLHSLLPFLWTNQLNWNSLNPNIPHCDCFAAASETVGDKRKSCPNNCLGGGMPHFASAGVDHNMLAIGCHRRGSTASAAHGMMSQGFPETKYIVCRHRLMTELMRMYKVGRHLPSHFAGQQPVFATQSTAVNGTSRLPSVDGDHPVRPKVRVMTKLPLSETTLSTRKPSKLHL